MHLIIYSSEYNGDPTPDGVRATLNDINRVASVRNAEDDISGVLFYYHQTFLQFVEGEKAKVMTLMARLAKDPRHSNVNRIVNQAITQRGFAQWNMPGYNLDEDGAIDDEHLGALIDACRQHIHIDNECLNQFYDALVSQKAA